VIVTVTFVMALMIIILEVLKQVSLLSCRITVSSEREVQICKCFRSCNKCIFTAEFSFTECKKNWSATHQVYTLRENPYFGIEQNNYYTYKHANVGIFSQSYAVILSLIHLLFHYFLLPTSFF